MRFISLAKPAAAVAVLAVILAACVVVEDGPRPGPGPIPGPGPGPRPDICTREYAPVCGVRRGDRRTFGNECMARAEGYRVVADGQCRRRPEPAPPPPVSCTMQYDPVCAVRGRDRRTFGNACEAGTAGYEIIRGGECRRG